MVEGSCKVAHADAVEVTNAHKALQERERLDIYGYRNKDDDQK